MIRVIGKILGACVGLILFGPLGLLIGLFIGHYIDSKSSGPFGGFQRSQNKNVQKIFFDTTFMVMGHIAKADGRVSEKEIAHARRVMQQMGLTETLRHEAIELFNKGKQANFQVNAAISQLRQACWRHPSLLKMFLEIQLRMAYADGAHMTQQKQAVLENIFSQLGIRGFRFNDFEQQFRHEQQYQRYQQQPRNNPQQSLSEAYQILGISKQANKQEIKKAYRKLMSENHPDKLIAQGLPQEMIKVATEKTQRIKLAYEQIMQNYKAQSA